MATDLDLERVAGRDLAQTNRYKDNTFYKGSRGEFIGFADEGEIRIDNFAQYVVKRCDFFRFDNVSWDAYKTPYLWWLLYQVNDVINPFDEEVTRDRTVVLPAITTYTEFLTRRL